MKKRKIIAAVVLGLGLSLATTSLPTPQPVQAEPVRVQAEVVTTWNVPLETDLQLYIASLCAGYHIEPALVLAMIEVESQYNVLAVGDNGNSKGAMQIQKRWHEERMDKLGVYDLLDPYQNVQVGIDYIAEQLGQGKGVEWALTAYNGGNARANRIAEYGGISEYAYKVLAAKDRIEKVSDLLGQ